MRESADPILITVKWNDKMHSYWRVIEELKFLGETWYFHDPTLKRHFDEWVKRRSDRINVPLEKTASDVGPLFKYKGVLKSLN